MRPSAPRYGYAWLELLLALAIGALLLQLFPRAASAFDVRLWSQQAWFAVNAVVLATLLVFRFLPDIRKRMEERQSQTANEKLVQATRQKAIDRRQAIESARQARKRRLY